MRPPPSSTARSTPPVCRRLTTSSMDRRCLGSRIPLGIDAVAGGLGRAGASAARSPGSCRVPRTTTGSSPRTRLALVRGPTAPSTPWPRGASLTASTSRCRPSTRKESDRPKAGAGKGRRIGISYLTRQVGKRAGQLPVDEPARQRRLDRGHRTRPLNQPNRTSSSSLPSAVSTDFTHTLIATNRKLTPDAVEDPAGQTSMWTMSLPAPTPWSLRLPPGCWNSVSVRGDATNFVAGASDFSWIVFRSIPRCCPEPQRKLSTAGARPTAWKSSLCSPTANRRPFFRRPVCAGGSASADGSRIYFVGFGGAEEGAFLWEKGEQTKAISVSHVPGNPPTPHPGVLVGASEDGRYAFFASTGGAKLTATPRVEWGRIPLRRISTKAWNISVDTRKAGAPNSPGASPSRSRRGQHHLPWRATRRFAERLAKRCVEDAPGGPKPGPLGSGPQAE